jgi:protein SCO1
MLHHCTHTIGAAAAAVLLAGAVVGGQDQTHPVTGMVVEIKPAERQLVVSHDPIPGVMPAMIMPFDVRDGAALRDLAPGTIVRFTLRMSADAAYAEDVQVVRYQSVEQDPLAVRRLRLLRSASAPAPLSLEDTVPDFTLTNQAHERVALSQLRGQVVALNFVYTSCALPQFCYRMANHFGVVQQRFAGRGGRDLVLLTITFDPVRDTPERLAEYAAEWDADPAWWHFLTGPTDEIARVAAAFGLDYYPDEGLVYHSTRTAVIDRDGRLVANVEGNRFTARQLGDLLEAVLDRAGSWRRN